MAGNFFQDDKRKVLTVIETLLLVDSETPQRNALKFILELNGYRVVEATHGIEGWQILDGFGDRIHLALCAADLPDMTGPEWLSHVRILSPELPAVMLGERERSEVCRLMVGPWYGGLPARAPSPTGLMEKIRGALDERFFSKVEKVPA